MGAHRRLLWLVLACVSLLGTAIVLMTTRDAAEPIGSRDGSVVAGDFSLAVWDGAGWTYQYQLFGSDAVFAEGTQAWRTWRERTSYFPDQAVGGDKPINLVIPTNTVPGDYRLCAESATPPICSGLAVTDP